MSQICPCIFHCIVILNALVFMQSDGTCSSNKGFRLPLLFSLHFMLHSNCGVNASLVSHCVTCINSYLNKRWAQNNISCVSLSIHSIPGSVYLNGWNYQADWECLVWSSTTALSQPTHTKSTLRVPNCCESGLGSHDIIIYHDGSARETPCDQILPIRPFWNHTIHCQ